MLSKLWNYLTQETYRVKIKKWATSSRHYPQVKYGIIPVWFNFSCGEYDLVHIFEGDAWESIRARKQALLDLKYLGTVYKYKKD